jgi:hypothetical protein
MSRPRCDPIDYASVMKALGERVPARTLYADYASTAARPYARIELGGDGRGGRCGRQWFTCERLIVNEGEPTRLLGAV